MRGRYCKIVNNNSTSMAVKYDILDIYFQTYWAILGAALFGNANEKDKFDMTEVKKEVDVCI